MKRRYAFGLILGLVALLMCAPCAMADGAVFMPSVQAPVMWRGDGPVARCRVLALSPVKKVLYLDADGVGTSVQVMAKTSPSGSGGVLSWTSSRPGVASVDAAGVVTARSTGTTTITCRTTDGSKLKRTCVVAVKNLMPASIALSQSALEIAPNARVPLYATVEPKNAVDHRVVWKSSNPSVARVSTAGVVTGVKLGTATITAKTYAGGLIARAKVRVCFTNSDIYYIAIGQEHYNPQSPIPGAKNDADRFVAALSASDFGQKSMQGETLYDLSGVQLTNAFATLAQRFPMDENDVTYVYYSGHGMSKWAPIEMRGALIGVDYGVSGAGSPLTVDAVRAYLDRVPGTIVVVLDCCLSGQFITAKGASSAQSIAGADSRAFANSVIDAFKSGPQIGAKGLGSLISGNANKSKYKILVACKPLQNSYAYGISGFTRFVCEAAGIGGGPGGAIETMNKMPGDGNRNGWLSMSETYQYAYPKILKWARRNLETSQNMMVWPERDVYPIFARRK